MTGRIAVDFGTSNTVVSIWDEEKQDASTLFIPEYSRAYRQGDETTYLIPSLIHYTEDQREWIGAQVIERKLQSTRRTFRWMKQYISARSPIRVRIDDREITPFVAGKDFLTRILFFASQQLQQPNEEVAFSVPVDAYEHYENWLASLSEQSGIPRFRLIDEPSAAALGYSSQVQPGSLCLLFDFGGGTLHASIVLIEQEPDLSGGKRCRVLGKAGKTIGGSRIDQWLFSEILKRNHRQDTEEEIRAISPILLVACEKIKETLSSQENAIMDEIKLPSGTALHAQWTRSEFEDLLDQNGLFTEIGHTIRTALNTARERGFTEDQIQHVWMVGGSSQIPSVQRTIRQIFGRERVHFDRPMDAVSRGAAAFIAGVDFFDHIQHDYAIRYFNPKTGQHEYKKLVEKGTSYPTNQPVSRLSIQATFEGQKKLGIAIFEMGETHKTEQAAMELVFDPTGAARLMPVTVQQSEERRLFWMNEKSPTFLEANPPAQINVPRFDISFSIDQNKRLTITARDMISQTLLLQDHPVVKLV